MTLRHLATAIACVCLLLLGGLAHAALAQSSSSGSSSSSSSSGSVGSQSTATGGAAYADGLPTRSSGLQGASRPLHAASRSAAVSRSASVLAGHPLRRGSRGRLVRVLQTLLTAAGYRVRARGLFDRRTAAAVARVQRARSLPVTGIADDATDTAIADMASAASAAETQDAGWIFPLSPVATVAAPRSWSTDQGVDLGGNRNQCGPKLLELAVASGKVVKLGLGGFGSQSPVIKLDSGPDAGRYVYYGHARPALVSVGQHVVAGQPVAQVGCGRVGISSAPHLELGISPPGGGPNPPSWGRTSGEVMTQLRYAYDYARAHPESNRPVGAVSASRR